MAAKQDIRKHLEAVGWTQDRWGHLRKSANSREYRIKLSKRVVRVECKIYSNYPDRKDQWEWLRMTGGYYNQIKFHQEPTGLCLQIGTEFFRLPRKQIKGH